MNKPFFKSDRQTWYVHHEGKMVRLARDEAEAYAKWSELQAGKRVGIPLRVLVAKYLAWCGRNNAPATLASYKRMLDRWTKHHGNLFVEDIRPHHLDEILQLEFKHCGETSHWQFYKAALVAFNWGVGQGIIESHKLEKIKNKPQCGVRETCINQAEFDKLLNESHESSISACSTSDRIDSSSTG
jgi:hypothetical protein